MPVDPNIAAVLQMIAGSGYPPMWEGSPETGRRALRALSVDMVRPEDVIPVGSVEETTVDGGAGARPARLYRPDGGGPWPTTLYFHGGGFVVGDLDTHDQTCRRLCRDAQTVVVSVDYRLAPEHRFPAAVEDALAATRWAVEHLETLGGDDRLGVAGDSAGGNLAATAAQTAPAAIVAQLLIYPAVDMASDYPSRTENAEGYLLDLPTVHWFLGHYVSGIEDLDLTDPRLSPLRAPSLRGLPPAVVATAEFDPLRDEGVAYAEALAEAGVHVDTLNYPGLIHGFLDLTVASPAADSAFGEIVARFKKLLHT